MNHKQLMALAMNANMGMLHLENAKIPVKITEVEHDSTDPKASPMTTFKCLVVNDDQIKSPGNQAVKEFLNSKYGNHAFARYAEADVRSTMAAYVAMREYNRFRIDRVIFNAPATIIFWADGTKTVVKCQEGDVYSKETGLALCIAKKSLGNKSNFNNVFHEWIPEESEMKESDVPQESDPDPAPPHASHRI